MVKKTIHVCTKEKELAEMHTDIQWIKKTVAKIERAVNGNGSVGLLARMNQYEGGLLAFKFVAGSGGIVGIIALIISIYL